MTPLPVCFTEIFFQSFDIVTRGVQRHHTHKVSKSTTVSFLFEDRAPCKAWHNLTIEPSQQIFESVHVVH